LAIRINRRPSVAIALGPTWTSTPTAGKSRHIARPLASAGPATERSACIFPGSERMADSRYLFECETSPRHTCAARSPASQPSAASRQHLRRNRVACATGHDSGAPIHLASDSVERGGWRLFRLPARERQRSHFGRCCRRHRRCACRTPRRRCRYGTRPDPEFAINWSLMERRAIYRGAYLFLRPSSRI
jgi:hypothetical protein